MFSLIPQRLYRVLTPLIIGLLVLASVLTASAQTAVDPSAAKQKGGIVTSQDAGIDVTAAQAWTKADMAAAIPLDLTVDAAAVAAMQQNGEDVQADLSGGLVVEAGTLPNSRRLRPEGINLSSDLAIEAASTDPQVFPTNNQAYAYPPPFTTHEVFTGLSGANAYRVYPYTAVGKLFFTQNGSRFVCSASVVGLRVIYTAGHCVHAGNNRNSGFSTNIIFVPAAAPSGGNVVAPLQIWNISFCATTTQWFANGIPNGLRRDLGACRVAPRSGVNIATITGSLSFIVNATDKLHWHQFGYPAASPFPGNRMFVTTSSINRRDTGISGAGPAPMGVGSNLTGGSSGGPWVASFSKFGGFVNGVNSYKYTNQQLQMYSPYFDSLALAVRNAVQ